MAGGVIRSIIATYSPRINIEAKAPDSTRGPCGKHAASGNASVGIRPVR